ncbi:hypothetical protein LEP1GSC125_2682 [Leptospira mayottensis 200901122]|uniref:Uncharacterized protein n=1 Tax=Leptospira mayottensis 200901122 TaxID=1193010 RepID=A0AA87SX08_9LEPT|nr:hypothetical protein LEP1GSC125_2682 [Leptospira mayottensis 200901122]
MRKNIYSSGWGRHIRVCLKTSKCRNYNLKREEKTSDPTNLWKLPTFF